MGGLAVLSTSWACVFAAGARLTCGGDVVGAGVSFAGAARSGFEGKGMAGACDLVAVK